MALGGLHHLGQAHVHRAVELVDPVEALLGEVERHVHLVEHALEPGVAVAGLTGDDRHGQ